MQHRHFVKRKWRLRTNFGSEHKNGGQEESHPARQTRALHLSFSDVSGSEAALRTRVNVYLVEADDVGVFQQLHDLHLSEDLFQVFIIQLGLIDNFYSHLENEETRKEDECLERAAQTGNRGIATSKE